MPTAPHVSVVSPVYQAERVLAELVERIAAELTRLGVSYEIILIDDGSTDASWAEVQRLAQLYPTVQGQRLSRNFGQHLAITAGLDAAQGEWVVVMDCDLQDRPEEIGRLYAAAQQGYDAVLAGRTERQDGWLVRTGSRLFYAVLSYLTGVPQRADVANFGIYHRRVVQAIGASREAIRYFPAMVRWVGFRQLVLPVQHQASERPTTYNLGRRLALATDVMLAYSDKPLRLAVYGGLLLAGGAFLLGLLTLLRYLLGQITVPGYASLLISISFFSGLIILVLGIVGLYVGKTFADVRRRPLYLVAETTAA